MPNLEENIEIMSNKERLFEQKTEMGDAFDNIDRDIIDPLTKMSTVDLNANLTKHEESGCLVFDELKRLGLTPITADISRQKKRISRSRMGFGSEQKVRMMQGERENKSGSAAWGNLFRRQE